MNRFAWLFGSCIIAITAASHVAQADSSCEGRTSTAVTCTVADGAVRVDVQGFGTMTFTADELTDRGDSTWDLDGNLTVTAPGDVTIPIPGVSLELSCSPLFSATGTWSGWPDLGGLGGGDSGIEATSKPYVALGVEWGETLRDDYGIPTADCRPYLYFAASDSWETKLTSSGNVTMSDGDAAIIAIDPFDPAFVVQVEGAILEDMTSGLLDKAGFGLSLGGNLQWHSAVDLPGEANDVYRGHVYSAARIGIVPVAESPLTIKIEGSTLIDLGGLVGAAEYYLGLLTGSVDGDMELSLHDIVGDMKYQSNLESVSLVLGYVEIDLAEGSLVASASGIDFAARTLDSFEPNDSASGGSFDLLDSLLIGNTYGITGHIGADGQFDVRINADLHAGPIEYEGATLILSNDGVAIEGGELTYDDEWFQDLYDSFGCDTAPTGSLDCSLFGFDLSMSIAVVDGVVTVSGSFETPLGGPAVDFSGVVQPDGSFTMTGTYTGKLFGFSLSSATVTVTDTGFSFHGAINLLGNSITLDGIIGFDGSYHLSGTGTVALFGWNVLNTNISVDNGGVRLTSTLNLSVVKGTLSGSVTPTNFSITGTGDVTIGGFTLAHASLSGNKYGLSVSASATLGPVAGVFSGKITSTALSLSGVGSVTVGGYYVGMATFQLSSATGLTASGMMTLGPVLAQLSGRIYTNGDVELASHGAISVPTPWSGVTLDMTIELDRHGASISVNGHGSVHVLGKTFSATVPILPGGIFTFSDSVSFSASASVAGFPISLSGHLDLFVAPSTFSLTASANATVGPYHGSVSGSVSPSGGICVDWPGPIGNECIDVL